MDYGKLRAAALRDGEDEEAVTVDTRALIDKVLARYSGEWTTLRELIQNAADAQATTVKIKWETMPSTQIPLPSTTDRSDILKHTLTNHTLRRLVVQNNGQPFTRTDWGRLKRIAEGNPDETKIGAFGVGFYSVFADCEEPFVSSGNEAMAFYWKGNALFTRKLQLPEDQCTGDTAFVLDYRNTTTTLPNLLSVSQFLATSLTFVALQHIEFWIDDYQVLSLHKKTSPSVDVPLSRDVERTTKERLMTVQSVERTSAQIDASYMSAIGWKIQAASAAKSSESYGFGGQEAPSLRSFFSRLTAGASGSKAAKAAKEEKAVQEAISEDITAMSTASIFLRVTTAAIKTSVAASFSSELERATKKPPPKVAKISVLTSSYDETQASENSASSSVTKSIDVFSSVLPSKKPGGRIFIGFPTTQTTGAGMHISAPSVIPTVEREAIDLNARWVRTWNIEMLRAAGIMTRLAFANEMAELHQKVQIARATGSGKLSREIIAKYMPEALHILTSFTFGDSTPSGHVSQLIEEAFWTSYKKPFIEVYSSQGVLPTTKVRLGSEDLARFVDGIPVIPLELQKIGFVQKLIDFALLTHINVGDIQQELSGKPLNKAQLVNFIQWAAKSAASRELDPPSRDSLLDVAVGFMSEDGSAQGDIIALGTIKTYLSPNKIPAGLPIPPTTIPFDLTSKCTGLELQALGWEVLELVPWLRFLIESRAGRGEELDLTQSPKFAVHVLAVLSKGWDNLSQGSKSTIIMLLQSHTVIPTKMGMRKPTESFFPSVKLFDDLPVIEVGSSLKDKFLVAIGVRKTVDLDTIFKRLLHPASETEGQVKWSHVELVKYLASVRADIPADDLRKLKESRICPAEAGPLAGEQTKSSSQLYKVSELFEPKAPLRELGLHILQWPGGGLRPGSPEGKFLSALGLRSHPTVAELVDMMSSADLKLRSTAMDYFIANHHTNGYAAFNIASTTKAFLPLQSDPKQLVPPSECYTNTAAAVLSFNILKSNLHVHANKFGVLMDPPITECVNRLIRKPPQSHQEAVGLFHYFASRINELSDNLVAKLRDAQIVPVTDAKRVSQGFGSMGGNARLLRPRQCYLGTSAMYAEIFDFVDFGPTANQFLFRCGSKSEPTKLEIAQLAADEPAKLLSTMQSSDKYLNLLRSLAEDMPILKRDKDLWKKMKISPFLLGFKEISATPKKGENIDDNDDEEPPIRQYHLASAQKVVILDDFISYRLFKDNLLCAPEEDALESFYIALGCPPLSSVVQESLKIGPRNNKQEGSVWLRKHVLERSKLFIHEFGKTSRDAIKHDAKWLEKHLTVEVVQSLALRRSLHGLSHTEKRTAASSRTQSGYVLYVAAESSRPDMYQVGFAVCQLILNRPSQQAYFFFEPFLKLDLLDLRARGYNVDRILRAKAAEARIAEEERRRALEAEQARIREREQEFREQMQSTPAIARERNRTPPPQMPGGFGFDSPEDSSAVALPPPPPGPGRGPRGFLQNLSKRFGLDSFDDDSGQTRDLLGSDTGTASGPAPLPPAGASSSTGGKNGKVDGEVTNPAVVQQNLLNAVKSTRAHDSPHLFSPPTTQEVKEQATYCDDTASKDLDFAADASNGMRFFVAKSLSVEPVQILSTHIRSINAFAALLKDVGEVYSINSSALHMFYDESGGTIAFNRNGSIFCNLRFYLQLHAGRMQGEGKAEVAVWWWVVLAHELAHNIIHPHNADHSYYTESFIQQYFPRIMMKVTSIIEAGVTPPTPSGAPPPYRDARGSI